MFDLRVTVCLIVCLASFTSADEPTGPPIERVELAVARDRAELLHDVYSSSLHVIHRRYFHAPRAMVPAKALEDVFSQLEDRRDIQAKWISASFTPMNIDHTPETEFEKMASRKLSRGTPFVEVIEDGWYRRAGSIAMNGRCVNCHAGHLQDSPAQRFGGLVISIPVKNASDNELTDFEE